MEDDAATAGWSPPIHFDGAVLAWYAICAPDGVLRATTNVLDAAISAHDVRALVRESARRLHERVRANPVDGAWEVSYFAAIIGVNAEGSTEVVEMSEGVPPSTPEEWSKYAVSAVLDFAEHDLA